MNSNKKKIRVASVQILLCLIFGRTSVRIKQCMDILGLYLLCSGSAFEDNYKLEFEMAISKDFHLNEIKG